MKKVGFITHILLFVISSCIPLANSAQQPEQFSVYLEPMTIPGFPGLHSFNFSQHDGKWLIIGGRKDGLHTLVPGAFPASLRNDSIYVVNPESGQVWKSGLTALPQRLRDQMSSTNANFITEHGYLFIAGGYGYDLTRDMKITFPMLTAIRVDSLIHAVMHGQDISPWFQTLTDDYFAVTGGRLNYHNGYFYLAVGHRFDGEVSPIPVIAGDTAYWQAYTYAIRKMQIYADFDTLYFTPVDEWVDVPQMRRRDYNLVKQIFPDRTVGFTIFSGVFPQEFVGLPYLNPIDFNEGGYTVIHHFNQHLNHYHCANIPVYDSAANAMHTVFFGGVAQFTLDENGTYVEDQGFPFVKTIARVTRLSDGTLQEVKLGTEMPALLGSGSEFIINEHLPRLEHEIIDLNRISADSFFAGYIVGGIYSGRQYALSFDPELNSHADPTIYKVYFKKGTAMGEQMVRLDRNEALQLKLFPNPSKDMVTAAFFLSDKSDAEISIINVAGKTLKQVQYHNLERGEHRFALDVSNFNGPLLVRVKTKRFLATGKIHTE